MPMMARAMQSQLKKLKKLMTEKMSVEKAYSSVITHCRERGRGGDVRNGIRRVSRKVRAVYVAVHVR